MFKIINTAKQFNETSIAWSQKVKIDLVSHNIGIIIKTNPSVGPVI